LGLQHQDNQVFHEFGVLFEVKKVYDVIVGKLEKLSKFNDIICHNLCLNLRLPA
jgi:hypothetical protein